MFGMGGTELSPLRLSWFLTPEVRLALLAGAIGSMPVVPALRAAAEQAMDDWRGRAMEVAGALAVVTVLAATLLQVASGSYNPFIYFRF
jgi:hypothetical protein